MKRFFDVLELAGIILCIQSVMGLAVVMILSEIIGVISSPEMLYVFFAVSLGIGLTSLGICLLYYGWEAIKLSKEIDERRRKEFEEKDERGEDK
jgi:membrane protein implicated in regulation of membrane protease activity